MVNRLRHGNFIAKIEVEFEEEIHQRKISLQFNIRQLPNGYKIKFKLHTNQ